jgi:hypothetical protein
MNKRRNESMYKTTTPTDSSINIRHFLILALGGNVFLHNLIEEIYNENEWEYYENYLKSGFTDDIVIATFTTISEEKMKQTAGIVEWCYNHKNHDIIYKLIKKGYKFTYQYIQHRTRIDLQEFHHSLMKKRGGADNISDLELFNNDVITLYLCYLQNKPCELRNIAGEIFRNGLEDTYLNCMVKEMNFNEQQQEKYKEGIASLYETYPVPEKYDDQMNISRLFEYAIERKTAEVIIRDRLGDFVEARKRTFKEPYLKEIGALSGWVKTLGINEMNLTELTPFDKKDMDIIFMEFLIAQKENDITEDQRDLFIVACLWLQAIAHHYNQTKRLYLDESKKKYYIDMNKREEIIQEKERELREKEHQFNREKEEQELRIKALEEELRIAQGNLRKQEQKQKEMNDYSKEVHALRTYVYENQKEEADNVPQISIEEMSKEIQEHSIAIFGGHPNWKQKMKEVLPSVSFVDVDELNKDISFIDRLEFLCINTSVFNHSFYRKLMSRLNKNETKLFYLDGRSNPERNIQKMYKEICQKS